MASFLTSAVPTGYGGAGGSEIPPWVSHMYIWNQSVPVPSPAPPLPGDGWKDLPRLLGACSCLWRLAHHPGGEWMTFHFAWVLWSFRSGRRWAAICPGLGWVPVCSHQGLVDSCPAACQRLLWKESRFGTALVEVIFH